MRPLVVSKIIRFTPLIGIHVKSKTMATSASLSAPSAAAIMDEFSKNTGLSPEKDTPRRYLWTDAFAVCNFLQLYQETSDEKYKDFALKLVDQVHSTLGQYKHGAKKGWISGLSQDEGKLHPTAGGLRIGKQMPERSPDERYDSDLEWDRDGQYYHYITKWMHALTCVSEATGDPKYVIWAAELVKISHSKFTYDAGHGVKRMYWKMSVDLSRPQVPSMGHHDPLDGYISYKAIQVGLPEASPDLSDEIADMMQICQGKDWSTTDPLGLGGLLTDALRVMKMVSSGQWTEGVELLEIILSASCDSLKGLMRRTDLNSPAKYRLAFRELGLAIGFHAVTKMQELLQKHPELNQKTPKLKRHMDQLEEAKMLMLNKICDFWCDSKSRQSSTWKDHLDINMVMLATALMPDGFLNGGQK